MFTQAGAIPVTIQEAFAGPCKWPDAKESSPDAFSVYILVVAEDGQSDYWEGECSPRPGYGNREHLTRGQITVEDLKKLGLPNGDLTQLQVLVGRPTVANVKQNDKGYFNIRTIRGNFLHHFHAA